MPTHPKVWHRQGFKVEVYPHDDDKVAVTDRMLVQVWGFPSDRPDLEACLTLYADRGDLLSLSRFLGDACPEPGNSPRS